MVQEAPAQPEAQAATAFKQKESKSKPE